MRFLINTWYVAGWASELVPGSMLARTLLDTPVLIFRDSQSVPHAIVDRCPHRFAPLSMGKLCDGGDSVECPYHGLRFGTNGACVHNPHSSAIPRAARVRSLPIVEHSSALWIWMGDPQKADRTRIPHFDFLDGATWAVGTGSMRVAAYYELESDNILDLSHTEFLHPMFASRIAGQAGPKCTQEGNTVWSREYVKEVALPAFLQEAFRVPAGMLADRWRDIRWDAPAQMALWTGAVASGQPREAGTTVPSSHMFTPETAGHTHYFFSVSFPRTLGAIAEMLAKENAAVVRGPFENEDKPMIEAVARRMGGQDLLSLEPILLPGDAAAVRARRVLRKLIETEATAA